MRASFPIVILCLIFLFIFQSCKSDKNSSLEDYVEEKDMEVRYHCPNFTSEMLGWYNRIKQENSLMFGFTDVHSKLQTITLDFQHLFILKSIDSFDFNKMNHKALYWPLTLAE